MLCEEVKIPHPLPLSRLVFSGPDFHHAKSYLFTLLAIKMKIKRNPHYKPSSYASNTKAKRGRRWASFSLTQTLKTWRIGLRFLSVSSYFKTILGRYKRKRIDCYGRVCTCKHEAHSLRSACFIITTYPRLSSSPKAGSCHRLFLVS